jgi:hypothetical protein
MRKVHRRLLAAFVVAALFAPVHVMVVADTFDPRPTSALAEEWVRRNADNLPNTLEDLTAFPIVYRKQIFKALRPEDKSRLWREQLTAFLRTEQLTPAQQEFVSEMIVRLTPEVYAPFVDQASVFQESCKQGAALFSKEQRHVFSVLGGTQRSPSSWETIRIAAVHRLRSAVSLRATGVVDCDCTLDSWCTSCDACETRVCYKQDSGCGCFWSYECRKVCADIE